MECFSLRKKIFRCGLPGRWIMIWIMTWLYLAGPFRSEDVLAKPAPMRQPWPVRRVSTVRSDISPEALAVSNRGTNQVTNPDQVSGGSFWQESFLQAIRFFRVFISPADGDRCPMFPSCSQYAVEAVRTYGPWRGIVLTSDRLLRCGREDDYPLIHTQGGFRYYDPVGDNILWH